MHRSAGQVVWMAVLLGLCVTTSAWAGGFWLYEIATPDMGVAAAGRAAAAKDASTAFGNPAGMTRLDRSQLLAGFEPIIASVEFDPDSDSTVEGSDGGNAGGVTPGLAAYYVHSLSPRLKLGVSFGALIAGQLEYNNDWVGRYFVTEIELTTISFIPTVAYQVNDWLSIGAGPIVTYGILKQEAAINNILDRIPDGRLKVEDETFGFGGIVGILVEPWDGTRFGVQYTSQVDLSFEDVVELDGLGPGLQAALRATGLLGSEVDLDISLPHQVMVSVYHDLTDTLALMGNVGWQDWSSFGQTDVTISDANTTSFTADRNFKDTWHVAIGAQYRIAPPWLLSAGFAYDSSAVDDEDRTADAPLDRQLRYAAGVQYDWNPNLTLGLAYTFLDAGKAEINQRRGRLSGTLQGDYSKNEVHFVNINAIWRFGR